MAEYENNDIAMEWDDTIEKDSEFTLLPEGDYDFEVLKFERGRSNGSAKMSACPMAILSIKVFNKNNPKAGTTVITHNLCLNRKLEWKLCEFFTAIGDRKHGEPLKMNWAAVTGKTGRCKIIVDDYVNNKGEKKTNNKIDKFYEAAETPTTPTASFTPGKF